LHAQLQFTHIHALNQILRIIGAVKFGRARAHRKKLHESSYNDFAAHIRPPYKFTNLIRPLNQSPACLPSPAPLTNHLPYRDETRAAFARVYNGEIDRLFLAPPPF
jgi:hypothetical protein